MIGLFRYIKNLGVIKGLNNWIKVEVMEADKVTPKNCKYPIFLRPGTSDREVYREVFLFNDYGIKKSKANIIIDLGANTGYTSVYFANRFPEAKIIGVEPDHENFQQFLRNTEVYPNIRGLEGAIWNKSEKLTISNPQDREWTRQVTPTNTGNVQGFTMDYLIDHFDLQYIDIVKIDIEGAEKVLFSSNTEWLNKVDTIIIELHDHMEANATATFFSAINMIPFEMAIFQGSLVIRFIK